MKLHMNPNTLADLADVIRAMAGLIFGSGETNLQVSGVRDQI